MKRKTRSVVPVTGRAEAEDVHMHAHINTHTQTRHACSRGSAAFRSPAKDHDEVHHVPAVPQVGAFVEHEPQSHHLNPRLQAKHPNEVRLRFFLSIKQQTNQNEGKHRKTWSRGDDDEVTMITMTMTVNDNSHHSLL